MVTMVFPLFMCFCLFLGSCFLQFLSSFVHQACSGLLCRAECAFLFLPSQMLGHIISPKSLPKSLPECCQLGQESGRPHKHRSTVRYCSCVKQNQSLQQDLPLKTTSAPGPPVLKEPPPPRNIWRTVAAASHLPFQPPGTLREGYGQTMHYFGLESMLIIPALMQRTFPLKISSPPSQISNGPMDLASASVQRRNTNTNWTPSKRNSWGVKWTNKSWP